MDSYEQLLSDRTRIVDGGGAATTEQVFPRRRQALARALSRDLGPVDYPGAPGVLVEATYATAEYVAQSLGGATAVAALAPALHVAFLLTERTHTANLPADADPPNLYVNGSHRALVDRKIMTDSPHDRATVYRHTRDDAFGTGHQMVTLRLAAGQEATWHLPLVILEIANAAVGPVGLGEQWGLILALLGGMLAAMWPCLLQLTVYFIPALAGVAMQDAGGESLGRRRQVLVAANFFFILGFTLDRAVPRDRSWVAKRVPGSAMSVVSRGGGRTCFRGPDLHLDSSQEPTPQRP